MLELKTKLVLELIAVLLRLFRTLLVPTESMIAGGQRADRSAVKAV